MVTYEELVEKQEQAFKNYEVARENHPYRKTLAKIEKLTEKIKSIREQQEKLEEKANKQEDKYYKDMDKIKCSWGEVVLGGIAEELMKLNPELTNYEVLGSFGMNNEYGLFLFTEENYKKYKETSECKYITYSLNFFNNSEVWTGEMCHKFVKGTIGELNGGNYVCTPIKNISQLNEIMHKIKENK